MINIIDAQINCLRGFYKLREEYPIPYNNFINGLNNNTMPKAEFVAAMCLYGILPPDQLSINPSYLENIHKEKCILDAYECAYVLGFRFYDEDGNERSVNDIRVRLQLVADSLCV